MCSELNVSQGRIFLRSQRLSVASTIPFRVTLRYAKRDVFVGGAVFAVIVPFVVFVFVAIVIVIIVLLLFLFFVAFYNWHWYLYFVRFFVVIVTVVFIRFPYFSRIRWSGVEVRLVGRDAWQT